MSSVKAALKSARECLQKQHYLDAIRHGKTALKHDSNSYDALVYVSHLCQQSLYFEACIQSIEQCQLVHRELI